MSFTLVSCTDTDADPINADGAVQFSSSIGIGSGSETRQWHLATRATGTTWVADDAVGIYMFTHGTTTVAESAENRKYTVTSDGGTATATFTPAAGEVIYYPQSTATVDFAAYYPWKATGTGGVASDLYPVNVATQTTPANIDLLWATANNSGNGYPRSSTAVPLTFAHKLAKFILKPVAGAGITSLSGLSVSIKGMYTTNTFNVKTGMFGTPANVAAITPFTVTDEEQYEAIILPCIVATTGDVTVEFTLDGEVFAWKVPAETAFNSGEEHTWTVTLSRNAVTATGTIAAWGSGSWTADKFMFEAPTEMPLGWYSGDKKLTFNTDYVGAVLSVVLSTSDTNADAGKPAWITLGQSPLAATAKDNYTAYTYTFATSMNESTTDTRTAYAHIKAGATTLKVVKLEQRVCPAPEDVSYEAASNCYILAPGKAIFIPVSRANEHTTLVGATDPAIDTDTGFTTELLWADAPNLLADINVSGKGSTGYVVVETSSTTLVGDGGNAVVAVKVDGDIVWSWHIWVCADMPTKKGDWLDRNLGALSGTAADGVKTWGLYYQWGRKDPFPGSPNNNVNNTTEPTLYNALGESFTYAVQTEELPGLGVATLVTNQQDISSTVLNPLAFIGYVGSWMIDSTTDDNNWGSADNKTIYDPCPEGYRVPINGSWGISSAWSTFTWDTTNLGRDTGTAYGGWYPASGYRASASSTFTYIGSDGYCWSASPLSSESSRALMLSFNSNFVYANSFVNRGVGNSVRCVAVP